MEILLINNEDWLQDSQFIYIDDNQSFIVSSAYAAAKVIASRIKERRLKNLYFLSMLILNLGMGIISNFQESEPAVRKTQFG